MHWGATKPVLVHHACFPYVNVAFSVEAFRVLGKKRERLNHENRKQKVEASVAVRVLAEKRDGDATPASFCRLGRAWSVVEVEEKKRLISAR